MGVISERKLLIAELLNKGGFFPDRTEESFGPLDTVIEQSPGLFTLHLRESVIPAGGIDVIYFYPEKKLYGRSTFSPRNRSPDIGNPDYENVPSFIKNDPWERMVKLEGSVLFAKSLQKLLNDDPRSPEIMDTLSPLIRDVVQSAFELSTGYVVQFKALIDQLPQGMLPTDLQQNS